MNLYEFVFSPTGGTKKIADLITTRVAKNLDITNTLIPIVYDLTRRDSVQVSLADCDVAVVAVPSYGGRVPKTVAKKLEDINGSCAIAILVVVYGNRDFEDTLIELGDLLVRRGFSIIAGITAISRHAIVDEIAADRPDHKDILTLGTFADMVSHKIITRQATTPTFPGKRPYRKKSGKIVPTTFGKNCAGCMKCAAECPTGAINPENPKKTDHRKCIGCMRCVYQCPSQARGVSNLKHWVLRKMLRRMCAERKEPQVFV